MYLCARCWSGSSSKPVLKKRSRYKLAAEFSYVLIQAYDFLHLYKSKGVTLQVCGSDQWGNSIAGVDLLRRFGAKKLMCGQHLWMN